MPAEKSFPIWMTCTEEAGWRRRTDDIDLTQTSRVPHDWAPDLGPDSAGAVVLTWLSPSPPTAPDLYLSNGPAASRRGRYVDTRTRKELLQPERGLGQPLERGP